VQATTRKFRLAKGVSLGVNYGLDAYFDTLTSKAWNTFLDVGNGITSATTSQYAHGSRYLTSGIWTEARLDLYDRVELRAGGRGSLVTARAPGDVMAGRQAIDQTWGGGVGGGGVAVRLLDGVRWISNVDQGFRAPNLDDLTSRQVTGAGQQYENPDLKPERSLSVETGFEVERPRVELQVFGFQSAIDRLITRVPLNKADCPPGDNVCGAAIYNITPDNIDGTSII